MKPIEVAIALSLYAYNISPVERAKKIYSHFDGNCMDFTDLVRTFSGSSTFVVTELPYPSAVVYVEQAMEKYGGEACERVSVNER